MEAIYFFGVTVGGSVVGAILFVVAIIQLVHNARQFINDEDLTFYPRFDFDDFGTTWGLFWAFWFLAILIGGLLAMVWFIAAPLLVCFLCLLGMRYFKRFQKKIKEALGSKADKEHEHNQDDIVLND